VELPDGSPPSPRYHSRANSVTNTDREALKAALRAAGAPLYATDPEHPGMIIQVLPDGTRIAATSRAGNSYL